MRNWFKSIIAPSLKTKLMLICKDVAPDGVIYITVPNNMTFQMSYGKEVRVYVGNPKNGVQTTIWDTHSGFNLLCKQNTFLLRWFYEAVEQMHVTACDYQRAKEHDNVELVSDLFEMWENRGNVRPSVVDHSGD